MESDDTEYQCSECGTEVQSDTKICPNCGALLVDTEEEGDFVEMPVTSNPVDLSIIRSLLDKNRIKYSIKESSLNSVFGLPLGHTTILMVREDQFELVNQLLKDVLEVVVLENAEILYRDFEDFKEVFKAGTYFSVAETEFGYRIGKILNADEWGVHICLFSNHYLLRPDIIKTEELYMSSKEDDPERFGIFHLPVLYSSFKNSEPKFILNGIVSEEELEGYKIWKDAKGGYF